MVVHVAGGTIAPSGPQLARRGAGAPVVAFLNAWPSGLVSGRSISRTLSSSAATFGLVLACSSTSYANSRLSSAPGVSLPWIPPMLKNTGLPSPTAEALFVISMYLIVRPWMLL